MPFITNDLLVFVTQWCNISHQINAAGVDKLKFEVISNVLISYNFLKISYNIKSYITIGLNRTKTSRYNWDIDCHVFPLDFSLFILLSNVTLSSNPKWNRIIIVVIITLSNSLSLSQTHTTHTTHTKKTHTHSTF